MSTITIDDIEYTQDELSDEAKAKLGSMQACDQRIEVLQTDIAIAQTARNAYAHALRSLLPAKPVPKAKAKAKAKAKEA
jgi:hypothetical protein